MSWLLNATTACNVYLKDGFAEAIVRAVTLRWKLQIKLPISLSHSILTPSQLVPMLTLKHQALGRVEIGGPVFKYDSTWNKISLAKAGIEPRSTALNADFLPRYAEEAVEVIKERTPEPGTGIMEVDDRQVTRVFTVQPSFQHPHSTNRVS